MSYYYVRGYLSTVVLHRRVLWTVVDIGFTHVTYSDHELSAW